MTTENSAAAAAGSDFDKLLADIAGSVEVAKALPADKGKSGKAKVKPADNADQEGDDTIAAAAADGEEEGDEAGVAKSFEITLEDGTKAQAVDAGPMFKALTERADKVEAENTTLKKALADVFGLFKSLEGDVKTLRDAPRGRKTVLTVAEKPAAATDVAKAEADGMDAKEFMAKALSANRAEAISGFELTKLENQINAGQQPNADVVRRVINHSSK